MLIGSLICPDFEKSRTQPARKTSGKIEVVPLKKKEESPFNNAVTSHTVSEYNWNHHQAYQVYQVYHSHQDKCSIHHFLL